MTATGSSATSSNARALSIFPFVLASLLVIGIVRLNLENIHSKKIIKHHHHRHHHNLHSHRLSVTNVSNCNVFDGKWVWDNVSRPLYAEASCPYLTKQVTCQRNGRPDSLYQNWRWQPNGCKLPRFDAELLLEVLRNKRIMLVGDSLQRTMWESLVCLIHSIIPDGKKSIIRSPPMKIFQAEDYNVTVVFYWAPFVVESNSDHMIKHTVIKRLVKLDSIAKHSKRWKEADILVFESYVWWMYKPIINATNGPPYNVQEYNVTDAYRLAMRTWASWIDSTINPNTQKVFFMSSSPTHLWSWEWRPGSDENCFNETHPIQRPYWGTGSNLDILKTLGDVLQEMKVRVSFLNITQLSEYRKDGHTSVFTERRGKLLTKQQKADPKNFADCIHWCLPGVPDTWNEILYAYLLHELNIQ